MKKRFLAFLLAVSIAVSMLMMPASAAGSNAAVQAAVALGGMTTEQSAQLDLPLTRGQLARLLTAFSSYRESVAAQGSTGTLFSDVNGASAYGPYIRVAVQQSWLSGYLDGSFRPDNAVTLEEACTAVLKLLGYDVTALSGTFPAAQLNKASSLGLRSNISASQGSTLTLAEGAQLVYNALTASTSDGQVYGSTIGFTVTDGQIDVSSIVMVDLQGPFVAGADTVLPFVPVSIYRNDSVVSSADLSACDVYYYSESARTLWVYSRKAAGRITAVSPTASAPTAVTVAGTTYTINGGDVLVTDTSGVSLLFDEIIDTTSENRTSQLEDRAEESLPQLSSNRDYAYQFKYLDLVDANNGNAWVKASQDLTIYWPLPEGVDTSTLRVLHFEGLHRDMTSTNVEDAISGCTVTTVPHIVSGNYVTFQIGESGFSPFALVWETTTGGGGGGTTRYTITAEAGEGGSISPSGRVSVTRGSDKTFTISADDGYEIADVLVDGKSVGAGSRYTFENVRASHTIEVVFERTGPAVADPDDTGVSDWLNTEDHNAYLNGYPGSRFGPDNNMTRAEVAQMFYNLLLDKNVPITVTFDDVPADAWYTEAVNTLASLDILNGVGNNKFEPERSITRAEFTTIAMRFTNGTLSGTNIFPDVNPNDWFYDYVVGSIQYGWINGYPDGTFGPNDAITRAEVTTITNRMLGRSADEAFVDSHQDSLVQFGDITDRHWAYYQVMEATNGHDYTKTDGVEDWTRLN